MKYSLRSLIVVAVLAGGALGCGNHPYRPSTVRKIQNGIESVDKRAKEIEEASQTNPPSEPAP